jgi:urea transport system permease protein/urea transport system ATP-binding protein
VSSVAEAPAAAARAVAQPLRTRWRAVAACAFVALGLVAVGPFVLPDYAVNILVRSFLYAAVALTVDILWGYTGILTFGQSAYFGIGAYAAGLVFTHIGFDTAHALLALGGGLLAAALVAALVGWLSFYYGASPLYASVVSLVLPIVVTQLVFSGGTFTGSSSGLSGFPSFDVSVTAWFWISGAFLVVLTAVSWLFVRSDFGRVLVAIRDNEPRCAYLGINVSRVKTLLLVAAALVAALAGYVYAGYSMVVAPELTGFVFGTELVIWVALGGRATLLGPVVAAVVIDLASAYLSGELPFIWKLVIGLAFVVVIVALPQGFAPPLARSWRRISRRRGARPVTRPQLASVHESPKVQTAAGNAPAMEVLGVRKHFGSLSVLEGIDLSARHGELLSLVGPNGAGKTTLMRCMSDGHERSGGTVRINDCDIGRRPPYACVAYGIGRKFQTANIFETLTVAECLRVARTRIAPPSPWGRAPTLELPHAALQVIEATGLDRMLDVEARHLSHGMKQALDLAMVLALEPSVLLLDEPTAGLTKPERQMIGAILTALAERHRMCILLVEHDLDFVRVISSRVVVLHQGRILLDGTVGEVVESDLVKTIYSGGSLAGTAP